MKLRLLTSALFLACWLWTSLAFAGVEQISETEFRDLAQELSTKVNLFQEGWAQDSKAEFYGGTTRDYLYWLKGQFKNASSPGEAKDVIKILRAQPMIDVRDFIIGDSDVDIISDQRGRLRAEDFGVRKIDTQSSDILHPETELGQNEKLQGYIPAEKIRLGKDGFHPTGLGDGLSEIYSGKLSVHFTSAEDFARSKFAREGINHPILLALRYIRVEAINYFRTHGKGFPDVNLLLSSMDPESARQVKEIIQKSASSDELGPLLEHSKFKSWLNGAIQKSFRSYTNPTAALKLMQEFGVDQLATRYAGAIDPINQYVFSQYRDPEAVAAAMKKFGVSEEEFFRSREEYFPDNHIYHGTKTEPAFRGILFQGILPSERGSGGKGLYGVSETDKNFSEKWAGDKNRLLKFEVSPSAKIVDITQGEGKRVFKAAGLDFEEFSRAFGVDIVRYPYTPTAFVVKNGDALGKPAGVYRQVLPLSEILKLAPRLKTANEVLNLMAANSLSLREAELVWRASSVPEADVEKRIAFLMSPGNLDGAQLKALLNPYWQSKPKVQDAIRASFRDLAANKAREIVIETVRGNAHAGPEYFQFIDSLFTDPAILKTNNLPSLYQALSLIPVNFPHATKLLVEPKSPYFHTAGALNFIRHAILNEENGKLALSTYQNLTGLTTLDFLSHTEALESVLLKNGLGKTELLEPLLSRVGKNETSLFAQSAIDKLAQYFPGEPRTVTKFLDLAKRRLGHDQETEKVGEYWFSQIAVMLQKDERIKEFFLGRLNATREDVRYDSAHVLLNLDLTKEETVKTLMAPFSTASGEHIVLGALNRFPDLGKEASRVKLALMLRTPAGQSGGQLQAALEKDPYPEEIRKFAAEILRAEKSLVRGKERSARHIEANKIEKLIDDGLIKMDDNLADAALYFLENFATKTDLKSEYGNLVLALPLEKPAIAARVQNLISQRGFRTFHEGQMDTILLRMKEFTPEVKAAFEKKASPAVKQHLAASRTSPCPLAFSSLAPLRPE